MRLASLLGSAAALSLLATTAMAQGTCSVNLSTAYTSNNGGSSGGAVFFDVTVASTVTITGIDVNTSVAAATPIHLNGLFTIAGTYVGNTASNAAWTNQGIDNGLAVSAGNNQPSHIDLATPFVLTPGTYGFAIDASDFNHRYTNGNGSNQSFTDGVLTMNLGAAQNIAFSGTPFTPRVFNGAIYYGSNNVLTCNFSGTPTLGTSLPHIVTFTDLSCTTDPLITAWAWDFDNDGITDSTAQNPAYAYTAGGSYTVRLTVTDITHGSVTRTRNNYVNIIVNDECTGAIPVGYGVVNGSTVGATTSAQAWPCASGGTDLWYVFTSPATASTSVSLCGSGFDTALEVLDGSLGCGSLTSIACNDDSCSLQSVITFSASAGGVYYIRVGGFAAASGAFTMDVEAVGSFTTVGAGCGTTALAASGSPRLGGSVGYTLTPGSFASFVWIGFTPSALPICPACTLGCSLDYVQSGSVLNLGVPVNTALIGGSLFTQGADLAATGGCVFPLAVELSNTIVTVIGS